jgi:hypothetical protein
VDPRDPRRPASGGRATTVACPDPRFSELPRTPATIGGTVPLTPGRDLGVDRPWNAWSETYLGSINDRRYGLDLKSRVVTATFGLDRRVTTDVVTGFSFSIEQGKSTGFGDFLRADTEGFSVGPYVAVRLSPNWAIDAALSYTQTKIDLEIAILNASYISPQYTGSVKLHGQYQVLGGSVRPKLSVNYSHIVSNAYDLQGRIFQGLPFERLINIHFPRDSTNLGYSEASVEATRIFSFSNGTQVMPYSELGVRYEFTPPYHDKYRGIINAQLFDPGVGPDGFLPNSKPPIFTRPGSGDFYAGLNFHFADGQAIQAGDQFMGRSLVNPDNNNWAPRFGLSYSPTNRWTIRTGAGMFYVQDSGNPTFDMARNQAGRDLFITNIERRNSNMSDPWAFARQTAVCISSRSRPRARRWWTTPPRAWAPSRSGQPGWMNWREDSVNRPGHRPRASRSFARRPVVSRNRDGRRRRPARLPSRHQVNWRLTPGVCRQQQTRFRPYFSRLTIERV